MSVVYSFVLQMSEWRCFARFCMHMVNKYVGIYSAASAAVTSAASAAVTSAAEAAVSSAAEAVTSAASAAVTSAASAAVSSAASAAVSSAASAAVTSAALRLVSSRCYCPSKLFGIYRQIIHFGFTRGIMSTCTHAHISLQFLGFKVRHGGLCCHLQCRMFQKENIAPSGYAMIHLKKSYAQIS